jgi:DNA mismatch repair protein PMS2
MDWQGTTATLMKLFTPLPVRQKEFERNTNCEYGKGLSLLTAYALGPCTAGNGIRLTASNQLDNG